MNRKYLRAIADEQGFICKPNRKTPTLRIFEDGTILRADVRLDLCQPMTVKDAFKTLGITQRTMEEQA
jgi:hypothetical protein